MITIKARAKNKITDILAIGYAVDETIAEKILSIPELAVVDRKAKREVYDPLHQVEVEVPEGWVKEIK